MALVYGPKRLLSNPILGLFANYATKAKTAAEPAKAESNIKDVAVTDKTNWNAVEIPKDTLNSIASTTEPGASFLNDLRSNSGLGLGDGITNHTDKWLQGKRKSPMQYIQEAKPIKVSGAVVASYGSDDPALGCPVEYINLKGTSIDNPAVCKYTGNRYYSDDWRYHH